MTRPVTESDAASPSTTMDYSGGLDLTSYKGSLVNKIAKKGSGELAVSYQDDPDASLILFMPASPEVHPGGRIWRKTDADYRAIRQWIVEGARDN